MDVIQSFTTKSTSVEYDGGPEALLGGRYKLGRIFYKRKIALVREASDTRTNQTVAVKIHKIGNIFDLDRIDGIHHEFSILRTLSHPNIVRVYENFEVQNKICMVMELVHGRSLYSHINAVGPMREDDARLLFTHIATAVAYCHRKGVAHRDLKPENIMVDVRGHAKIIDFGMSVNVKPLQLLQEPCGTLEFLPPEVMDQMPYMACGVDVWMLGVILYEMVVGSNPFAYDSPEPDVLAHRVSNLNYHIPAFLSRECKRLIRSMLSRNSMNRPGMEEVLKHPWLVHGSQMDLNDSMQRSGIPSLRNFESSPNQPLTSSSTRPRTPTDCSSSGEASLRWLPPLGGSRMEGSTLGRGSSFVGVKDRSEDDRATVRPVNLLNVFDNERQGQGDRDSGGGREKHTERGRRAPRSMQQLPVHRSDSSSESESSSDSSGCSLGQSMPAILLRGAISMTQGRAADDRGAGGGGDGGGGGGRRTHSPSLPRPLNASSVGRAAATTPDSLTAAAASRAVPKHSSPAAMERTPLSPSASSGSLPPTNSPREPPQVHHSRNFSVGDAATDPAATSGKGRPHGPRSVPHIFSPVSGSVSDPSDVAPRGGIKGSVGKRKFPRLISIVPHPTSTSTAPSLSPLPDRATCAPSPPAEWLSSFKRSGWCQSVDDQAVLDARYGLGRRRNAIHTLPRELIAAVANANSRP